MKGYPDDWDSRRRRVYKRDKYTCQNCGARGGSNGNAELHAHHIVPKSKGGSHDLDNLKTLCSHCHNTIHEGGIISPKLSFGNKKKHLFYLFTTAGIGNIFHGLNSINKSASNKYTAWKRMKRAKYGSFKIHTILFFTTAGLGNILYYMYTSPTKPNTSTTSNSGISPRSSTKNSLGSASTTTVDRSYDDYVSSLNWDRYDEYRYEHYSDAIEDIKQLKREKKHDEVEELLFWCIEFVEAVSEQSKSSKANPKKPAKAYYRHLAIVYRKEDRYDDEVSILERYINICKSVGVEPNKNLSSRLQKARKYR